MNTIINTHLQCVSLIYIYDTKLTILRTDVFPTFSWTASTMQFVVELSTNSLNAFHRLHG